MIRKAELKDLEFLIKTDLKDEGITITSETLKIHGELEEHRKKILNFVTDENYGAFIFEKSSNDILGLIMYSIENRDVEYPWKNIYKQIDRSLFQENGLFVAIFQLWVDPNHRRRGIATRLKQEVEEEAERRGINLIYTHTEEKNLHVVELNKKLGYEEVRRGEIWDDIIRVSLIKQLDRL
ncbi:GNAT family N-acetyltransferase [Paenibacillus mendelii]|uniref:GNAT family N-acetyltransferase n=1 Tax=Paenibacillus mendelii TaxID=206163 RepID=A0ABV6JES3_9BACL|nr:GNAT family N-acetyltransferase [Paenibacillus mendelii]MCQ6557289.1 GNAT family N-acetyltransferase [Paenibacillus mendelii]